MVGGRGCTEPTRRERSQGGKPATGCVKDVSLKPRVHARAHTYTRTEETERQEPTADSQPCSISLLELRGSVTHPGLPQVVGVTQKTESLANTNRFHFELLPFLRELHQTTHREKAKSLCTHSSVLPQVRLQSQKIC